jgi:hypothetical protein
MDFNGILHYLTMFTKQWFIHPGLTFALLFLVRARPDPGPEIGMITSEFILHCCKPIPFTYPTSSMLLSTIVSVYVYITCTDEPTTKHHKTSYVYMTCIDKPY